ncbi:MAG: rhomboid family intramembrane serine protease [Verrucomicrobiae bacterium]|nr:rhomboid family intramembrane serine protease [Verrucomicrobiae bacterium]
MKAFWQSLPPGTRLLASLHALGFVALALLRALTGLDLGTALALDASALSGFQVWRLVTYCLVSGDPLNAFFGSLFILFLGPGVERAWSPARMIIHYLACGVASGVILAWILRHGPGGILTNAGALLGLLVPWFLLNRFQRFHLFFGSAEVSAATGALIAAACIVAPFALSCGWQLTPGIAAAAPASWLILLVQTTLHDRRTRTAAQRPRMGRLEL